MKTIKVELTGLSPLLMNSPNSMIDSAMSDDKVRIKTEKYNLKDDAEKLAYKDEKGFLYVPSTAVKGAMVNAAAYKKINKVSAKRIISAGVIIPKDKLSLNTKDYKLDIRTVVIQRARVVKARPLIEDWKLDFEIQYNERLTTATPIKEILAEAGMTIGLLDFRPQKSGSFGMFEITKWEEK